MYQQNCDKKECVVFRLRGRKCVSLVVTPASGADSLFLPNSFRSMKSWILLVEILASLKKATPLGRNMARLSLGRSGPYRNLFCLIFWNHWPLVSFLTSKGNPDTYWRARSRTWIPPSSSMDALFLARPTQVRITFKNNSSIKRATRLSARVRADGLGFAKLLLLVQLIGPTPWTRLQKWHSPKVSFPSDY